MDPSTLPVAFLKDLVVGVTPFDDLCVKYGYDPAAIRELSEHPVFRKRRLAVEEEAFADGELFKLRSRYLAHQDLDVVHQLARDPETPSSVRLQSVQMLAKHGGLEPQPEAGSAARAPQIVFNILTEDGESLLPPELVGPSTRVPVIIEQAPLPTPADLPPAAPVSVQAFFAEVTAA